MNDRVILERNGAGEAALRKKSFYQNPWLWVVVLYAVGCGVRLVLLTLFCSHNLFVMPDEILYFNMARSLHLGEGLAIRGQAVTFTAILYSTLISPLYALPAGANIHYAIQILNTLVMHTAVFPAFALAKRFGCSNLRGIVVVMVTLLLPDFFITSRVMAESLIFPLFLLAIWTTVRLFDCRTWRWLLAVLLTCFLLYLTKEGSIAMFIGVALVLVWKTIAERDKRLALLTTVLIAAYLALYWLWHLFLQQALAVNFNMPSIYDTQYAGLSGEHLLYTLGGLLLYFFFVQVGFGVLPLVMPVAYGKQFTPDHRWLLRLAVVALFVYMIGISYVIFYDEMVDGIASSRVHLRYLFIFLPLFLAALLSRDLDQVKLNRKTFMGVILFLVLLLFIGLETLLTGKNLMTFVSDSPLLAYMYYKEFPFSIYLWLSLLLTAGCLATLFYLWRRGWGPAGRRCFVLLLAALLIVANVFTYKLNYSDAQQDTVRQDATIVAAQLAGEDALLVVNSYSEWFESRLSYVDVALKEPLPAIQLDDLCPQVGQDSYDVPSYWVTGHGNEDITPDYLVFYYKAFDVLKLAPGCTYEMTPNGEYVIVEMPADGNWLHSGICGLKQGLLVTEETAFYLNDPDYLDYDYMTLRIMASTKENLGTISLSYGDYSTTRSVAGENQEYRFDIPLPDEAELPIRVDIGGSGMVVVLACEVRPGGELPAEEP